MNYKFDKAIEYYEGKRFLELSAKVFKIAFDIPEEKFEKAKDNEIVNSSGFTISHSIGIDDLIYFLSDELALTIEYQDSDDEYIRYSLYIRTEGFKDDYAQYRWYLVSYVENNDVINYIHFDNNKIKYNKNDNCIQYLCSYSESNDFTVGYPFTKDVYFNYLMNTNLQGVPYEVLNELLELKYPDGFHGNFYDY